MIAAIIGRPAFRRGMDLYFGRHDGHAVTIDDFVQAMQEWAGNSGSGARHPAASPAISATLADGALAFRLPDFWWSEHNRHADHRHRAPSDQDHPTRYLKDCE